MTATSANATRTSDTFALLLRLFRDHVRPYVGRLVAAGGFMVVTAAATAATAWLLQPAIDEVFLGEDRSMLWLVPTAIIAVTLIKGLSGYGQSILMHGVGQRIIADTQIRLHRHLLHADLLYLQSVHSGELLSRFLTDTNMLRDAVSRALSGIVKDSLSAVFLVGVMFYQDWKLSLAVLFMFPALAVIIRKLGRRMRYASTGTQEKTADLSRLLSESLTGARTIKAYGTEEAEAGRGAQAVKDRLRFVMKSVRTRSAATPLVEALGGMAIAVAVLYGGWQAHLGELTLGAFVSFQGALLMAYQPLRSLVTLNTSLQEGLSAAKRVFAILDVGPAIADRADAVPLEVNHGEIRFSGVTFNYGDDTAPALSGVDLVVPAGKTVALVGPSGSGKSTILNLIPRFFDVGEGAVTIDGQDVRDVTIASLRRSIGLVAQEAMLFDESVATNLLQGKPDANEVEMIAAAKAAAAHDFITALPQGYDTPIGEAGAALSGGQRQRLAIARAMLKNAPILLLDEATSALDSEAEAQVQAALDRLKHGHTALIIAHRLSTVTSADLIYVVDQGRIVESGSHSELIALGGTYARLYARQTTDDDGEPASSDNIVQLKRDP